MTDVDDETLEHIVEFYHKPELRAITDYEKVVENKTTISVDGETILVFEPPMQRIYLTTEGYPIDIGNQRVDINKNIYYYRWNMDPNVEEDTAFEYVAPYEWLRTNQTAFVDTPEEYEGEE